MVDGQKISNKECIPTGIGNLTSTVIKDSRLYMAKVCAVCLVMPLVLYTLVASVNSVVNSVNSVVTGTIF